MFYSSNVENAKISEAYMYTIRLVEYSLHSFSRVLYSESDDFISALIFLSTDFIQEAKNSERIGKNFKHNKMITIPTVFWV